MAQTPDLPPQRKGNIPSDLDALISAMAIPGSAPPAPPKPVSPVAPSPAVPARSVAAGPGPAPKPGPRLGRVIVLSGPKEGVGKSVLAANIALAWAGSQHREVVIIQMDPLGRNDLNFQLGLTPPSVASFLPTVQANPAGLGKLLKGRIPMTQWGVGLLPLAGKRAEALAVSPRVMAKVMGALSESYDFLIDVDPYLPLQIFAFDLADLVIWTTLPHRAQLEATYGLFTELKNLHFPLEKFEIVVNQSNLPGGLVPREVERFFEVMSKRVLGFLPWEDALLECANTQKVLIAETLQSEWVKALKPILMKIAATEPEAKNWDAVVPPSEFGEASNFVWKDKAQDSAAAPQASAAPAASQAGSVPPFWDDLKGKLHKLVVSALETERIRIADEGDASGETRAKVAALIEGFLQKEPHLAISRQQRERFGQELADEILGLGPLEQLMRDSSVNEIMVNSCDKIYIEQKGKLVQLPMRFRSDEQVIQVIKRIVAPLGRRIDESVPLVDARLKDGSRVNAIIAPLAVSGPSLTIRRFSAKPFTHQQLVGFGAVTLEMIEFVKNCVILRKNMIISGGTGTGKTTFLNMLSNFIPSDERIITVEDTAELKLMQEHWVRLESRPPNIEGKGEITIRDLVKNTLRMRPDRIVVGECRGAEALDMLQAMNTGHEGSLTTIHANSPTDAVSRLSAMCLMGGTEFPMSILVGMIASAVHLIVQLTRFADGKRRVTYIAEVCGADGLKVNIKEIFLFKQIAVNERGESIGYFTATGNVPGFQEEFKFKGLNVPLSVYKPVDEAQKRRELLG